MATQDLQQLLNESVGVNVQTINTDTTTTGNTIDTAAYESVTFVFFTGSYTDGTYTPQITAGAASDGSDASAVADTELLPTGTGQEASAALSAANSISKLGYRGTERYVTPEIVSTSTTSGADAGCIVILGHPLDSSNT